MAYITPLELWKSLGKDAFTKVRNEVVGTGNGVNTSFSLDHDNVVSGSETIYTDSTIVADYSIDLDDGELTLTASDNSVVTADYSYADIPDSHVQEILERADAELTESTGRTFTTSSTSEYIDVEDSTQDEYFLLNYPVITISSLQTNTSSSVTDTPSWRTLTQGLGNDFLANTEDLKVGKFRFIDNFPNKGKDRIKVTYTYGLTGSDLALVKELATLLATRQMINSTIYQTIFKGRDSSSPINLDVVENRIKELTRKLKKINIERP
ncbi:MAG: hypothetical protein ACTSR3_05695 [Candidatus Helarchaeota archaeon]